MAHVDDSYTAAMMNGRTQLQSDLSIAHSERDALTARLESDLAAIWQHHTSEISEGKARTTTSLKEKADPNHV